MEENSIQRDPPRRWRPSPEFWVVLAILGAFLFGLPGLFVQPAEQVLFNPQVYKQTLDELDAYERFPLIVGEAVAGGGNRLLGGLGDRLRSLLVRANYEAALGQIFPKSWIKAQAESLIDQFFAYFNFESEELNLVVDFRPVRARLSGEETAQVSATIVQGLPACNQDDLLRFGLSALTGQTEGLPLCRPPQQLEGIAHLLVQVILQGAGQTLPERMDLMDTLRIPLAVTGGRVDSAWERWFGVYRFYRQTGPWLPWIALLMVAMAGVLARRTTRGPLFWMGWALVLPGASALLIALILGLGSSQIVPLVIGGLLGEDVFIFDLLVDVLSRVSSRFVLEVAWMSLAVATLGALLILAWGWTRRRGALT